MSQPKSQLQTFKSWAGQSSDISYYLNSHHIDFHLWGVSAFARPIRVVGTAATGVANHEPFNVPAEDTITLTVQYENIKTGNKGIAIYTSSWIAPKSDVHSQQRFHYMGQKGEIQIDQAHRGYNISTDENGYFSVNPLYMKYVKDTDGYFAGQSGYGYHSLEVFTDSVININKNGLSVDTFDNKLATMNSEMVTAILQAGRQSLDTNGRPINIVYDSNGNLEKLQST